MFVHNEARDICVVFCFFSSFGCHWKLTPRRQVLEKFQLVELFRPQSAQPREVNSRSPAILTLKIKTLNIKLTSGVPFFSINVQCTFLNLQSKKKLTKKN